MKLKLDANGAVVVKDGLPVWEMPDGTELAYDVPAAHKKIGELTVEAKTHRTEKEAALTQLKAFEGVDVEAAKKALVFAQSADGKKIMDDETIKATIANALKPVQDQLAEAQKNLEAKDGHIYKLEVGNRFATSKFLTDKTLLTPDAAEALFGKHYKMESNKAVPSDANGNPIYSRTKPGEIAEFDEALEILYEAYPHKENYRKGSGHSGGGTPPGGGGKQGSKTMTRTQYESMAASDPAGASKFFSEGGTLTD